MKVFSLIMLTLLLTVDPATLRKINSAKSEAEAAFRKGDYTMAIQKYHYLVDSLGVVEDEVMLNLANAYYLAKDTASATSRYRTVTGSPRPELRSKAFQQLGNMASKQGRAEEALDLFKQAIKAEPRNDAARYNYEMLKKKLEEQKEQEDQQQQNQDQQNEDQQNKDQQNKDQQNKDQQKQDQQEQDKEQQDQQQQKDQEQQQKDQQEKEQQEQEEKQQQEESERKDMPNLDREKLKEMKISEEKARMILDAMRNQEKQYLQQQKRKPTQAGDKGRPDW